MPSLATLLDRVRATLADTPRVEEKRMFGGHAFMVNGKMCISVREDRLMFRIDPELHDRVLPREGCRTVVMNGRSYRGYVRVSADVVRATKELDYWAGLALAYNATAKAAKKKTAKTKTTKKKAAKAAKKKAR
jgi:TfoX/Sxy family transcriptional regulator of competence genes